MTRYFYSPSTGELINAVAKVDWMGETAVPPPAFDPALASAIWRGDRWEVVASTPPTAAVPDVVTRFQARAALHLAGLLGAVEAMMVSPDAPALARLAWQDAQDFRRDSPTVQAMAAALGMSPEQIDALFVSAAGITA